MKILFVCNTPFQIICSLNIYLTKFKNAAADIVIGGCFQNYQNIANKIIKTKLFTYVYVVPYDDKYKKSKSIRKLMWCRDYVNKNFKQDERYDVLLLNNYDIFTMLLYENLIVKNPDLKVNYFEEGYSSYLLSAHLPQIYATKTLNLKEKLQRNMVPLYQNIDKYLYFNPGFVLSDIDKIKLTKIDLLSKDNQELVQMCNNIFKFEEKIIEEYDKKYIFFEESFFADGEKVDDAELIEKLLNVIPRDQLLIKLHPRNLQNRFQNWDVSVCKQSGVPWELIQMNLNCNGKILLSISSGSILSSKLYFNDQVNLIYLYNCVNNKPRLLSKGLEQYLSRVMEESSCNNLNIPLNMDDSLELLTKLRG